MATEGKTEETTLQPSAASTAPPAESQPPENSQSSAPYDPYADPHVEVHPPDFSMAKPGDSETDSAVSATVAAAEASLMEIPLESVAATGEIIREAMQHFDFVEAPVPTIEFAVTALKCLGADRCTVFAKPPCITVWFGTKPGRMLAHIEPMFPEDQIKKLGEGAAEKMREASAAAHSTLLAVPEPPPTEKGEGDKTAKEEEDEGQPEKKKLRLVHDPWKYDYVSTYNVLDADARPVVLGSDSMFVTASRLVEEEEKKGKEKAKDKKEGDAVSEGVSRDVADSVVSIKTLVNQQRIVAKALTELRKFSGDEHLRIAIGDVRIVIDLALVTVEDNKPDRKEEKPENPQQEATAAPAAAAALEQQKPNAPKRYTAIEMQYNLEYSRERTCETY